MVPRGHMFLEAFPALATGLREACIKLICYFILIV